MLSCLLPGQEPAELFSLEVVPNGKVLDQEGRPLRAARIRIRLDPRGASLSPARSEILRRQPLPVVYSSRDGSFFLPLSQAQRSLGGETGGKYSLVVEKAGFHPWIEPLALGPRGYLGSRVVLRRVTQAERFVVLVEEPLEGMYLRLHRFTAAAVNRHLDLDRCYEVPPDGCVQVEMSLVPSPLVLLGNSQCADLGFEVQLLYPGRSHEPLLVRAGQQRVLLPRREVVAKALPLLTADGKVPQNPRGLYRCPDGGLRWFPLPGGKAYEDPGLPLLAIVAEGYVACTVLERTPLLEHELQPLAPEAKSRSLRIVDAAGQAVRQARVSYYPMTDLPARRESPELGQRRPRRRLPARAGRVAIPGIVDQEPGFLLVEAKGYLSQLVFEPRGIRREQILNLGDRMPHGSVELRLEDSDGRRLSGAFLRFSKACHTLGAFLGSLPRTDAGGAAIVTHLPVGSHHVQVIHERVVRSSISFKIVEGKVTRLEKELEKVRQLRVLTVGDGGLAVPFRAVQPYYLSAGGRRSTVRNIVISDSMGRVLLLSVAEDDRVQMREAGPVVSTRFRLLDGEEAATRLDVSDSRVIFLPLPAGNPVTQGLFLRANRPYVYAGLGSRGSAVLARMSLEPQANLLLCLKEGPPMRISGEEVAALAEKTGLLRLDQRQILRRIPVVIEGVKDLEKGAIRLELQGVNVGGSQVTVYDETGLRILRDAKGEWSLALRDRAASRCHVLHPECLHAELEVPASTGKDPQKPLKLKLKLQRGSPLDITLELRRKPNAKGNMTLRIRDMKTKAYVLYYCESVERLASRMQGNTLEFSSPVALPPGDYNIYIYIPGTSVRVNQNIKVKKGTRAFVEAREAGVRRKPTMPPAVRK